jgi:hypothetical protein
MTRFLRAALLGLIFASGLASFLAVRGNRTRTPRFVAN